jgi:hypothetical protein
MVKLSTAVRRSQVVGDERSIVDMSRERLVVAGIRLKSTVRREILMGSTVRRLGKSTPLHPLQTQKHTTDN